MAKKDCLKGTIVESNYGIAGTRFRGTVGGNEKPRCRYGAVFLKFAEINLKKGGSDKGPIRIYRRFLKNPHSIFLRTFFI